MGSKQTTVKKFDRVSQGFTERRYSKTQGEMDRRAHLILDWGAPLKAGDRVLELGCGDGSLACFLARKGFSVTGVDISPGMIEEARKRAEREGVEARFVEGDIDSLDVNEPFDAAVSFMGAFFTYLDDPRRVLGQLRPLVRGKVLLDWNHRSQCTPTEAAAMIEEAGFERVEWRPWFLTLEDEQVKLRTWLEERPLLSLMPLIVKRWRYGIYIKGEKAEARRASNGNGRAHIFGNPVPGSLAQRALMEYGQVTRGKRRKH